MFTTLWVPIIYRAVDYSLFRPPVSCWRPTKRLLLHFQVHGYHESATPADGTSHYAVHRSGDLGRWDGYVHAQPPLLHDLCTRVLRRRHAGRLLRRVARWSKYRELPGVHVSERYFFCLITCLWQLLVDKPGLWWPSGNVSWSSFHNSQHSFVSKLRNESCWLRNSGVEATCWISAEVDSGRAY